VDGGPGVRPLRHDLIRARRSEVSTPGAGRAPGGGVRRSGPEATLIRVVDGGRRVGERWIWRGVGLSLAPGDRCALVGPSGSGKTLLLRSVAGLDPLDEGRVELDGRPEEAWEPPAYRSRVVYLPQDAPLAEGTVEENVRLPFGFRAHRERSYRRSRAVELLGAVGRGPDLLARGVGDLSGGERQVVALVRALLLDPEVLLLDEPSASMDEALARGAEALVDGWMEGDPGRRAFLWTSHQAHRLDRLADRELDLRELGS